jgi:ADP-heptose:LPS heptosyltransferase
MATLVYHAGGLGDFVTALPAIRFWKSRRPAEKTVLLGIPAFGALAKRSCLVDDVFDVNSRAFLPLFHDRFSGKAGKILSSFESAIVFSDDDSPLIRNIRASGINDIHQQPPFPAARTHVVDYHLSLFADPGLLDEACRIPRVSPSAADLANATGFLTPEERPIAIHPGSGSAKKNWPFDRFLELSRMLRQNGFPIVWIQGPADGSFVFPDNDRVVSNIRLPVLAALISHCRAFVGNDSGVTHLAAAVNCPAVAIFGPSDPDVWGPRGKNVKIVYKQNICAPCHRTARRNKKCDESCLAAIPVEEVRNQIGTILP